MYIVQEFRNMGTVKVWEDRRGFETQKEALKYAASMESQWNVDPKDIRIVKEVTNNEHD